MSFLASKNGTCCIIGRPYIPMEYRVTLKCELENLIAHGITCYLFSGIDGFENLCFQVLREFQKTYEYIPIQLILFSTDINLLIKAQADFDAVICLRPQSDDPSFSLNRVAIEHSSFMVYFQLTDYGGSRGDIVYGEGLGLRSINIARRKKEDIEPTLFPLVPK